MVTQGLKNKSRPMPGAGEGGDQGCKGLLGGIVFMHLRGAAVGREPIQKVHQVQP